MEGEKESANKSTPEPLITENDDHQDKNVDHDHHDQQTMENKSASDEQVQVQHQDDHQDRPHKCPDCDNRYKTRRALYGHKKKHNAERNRIDSDSDFAADDEEDEEEESGDAISPPREKSLQSKKSPFAQTSSSSSNPLPAGNWSVTAKRSGGISTNLVSPTSSNSIDENESEALSGLMELSGEKPEAHTGLGSIIDRREENKAKGVKDKEDEEQEEHPGDFDLSEEENYENEKRRKKTKLMDDENSSSVSADPERAATESHDKDDDNNNGGSGDHVSGEKGGIA